MKQTRDINRVWQADLPRWRRRLVGPVRWLVLLLGLALAASIVLLANASAPAWRIGLWALAGLLAAGTLLATMKGRSSQRSWRLDDSVFEPSPGRSLAPLYEDREWSLPAHPLIRYPLSVMLIFSMYWMLVVHQMNLPGHFLVGLVVLALMCLWSWREPLLLVLMVGVGVALLSLIVWIASLSLPSILAVVVVLGLGLSLGSLALLALHKRKSQGPGA